MAAQDDRHVEIDGASFTLQHAELTNEWHVFRDLPAGSLERGDVGTLAEDPEKPGSGFRVVNVDQHGDIRANEELVRLVGAAAGLRIASPRTK